MKEEIIRTFQAKIFAFNKDDPTYEARKEHFENKTDGELDAVDSDQKNKRIRKKKFQDTDDKITDCLDPKKTEMVVEFNDREFASIKSFAVKKRSEVKVTTRFMSGKLLMFVKLSLKSFIYEVTEIFCFPEENTQEIYKKYFIEKVEIFLVLTDTYSTAQKFIFISDPNSDITEDELKKGRLSLDLKVLHRE